MITARSLKGLDLSPLEFAPGPDRGDYFCTPAGAKVLGWAEVDGIHFCTVKKLGGTVFAVNPMETPGNHVLPVADNLEDFLRLLLSCGGTAAIEQAHLWKDKAGFDAFLAENPITAAQRQALELIKKKLALEPMEDPFGYIKALQQNFDYHTIPRRRGYDPGIGDGQDEPLEWKVYFDGGRGGRAGKELPIGCPPGDWSGAAVRVLGLYSFGAGLALDWAVEVNAVEIREFMGKYANAADQDFSAEEQERINAENPLALELQPMLTLNGKPLFSRHGSGCCWVPESCLPEGERPDWAAQQTVEHYGLNQENGWILRRDSFPWATKRKPVLKNLTLTLTGEPKLLPGLHFATPIGGPPGQEIPFTHPIRGARHVLTVLGCEPRQLDGDTALLSGCSTPNHFVTLTYQVNPPLPPGELLVWDCIQSDAPRFGCPETFTGNTAAIGIIGGADGPVAIFIGAGPDDKQDKNLLAACSSLHFEPAERVEWRMVFHIASDQKVTMQLLP
ncbi:MAG: sodium ion-translocating decarboxylase subunit beta [Oscillospiraceae bacterium]|jgi:hypothetical protein|nr:sodium ion-translocating decarboxylase subunit beta [Oscillospiraceae bacterium]